MTAVHLWWVVVVVVVVRGGQWRHRPILRWCLIRQRSAQGRGGGGGRDGAVAHQRSGPWDPHLETPPPPPQLRHPLRDTDMAATVEGLWPKDGVHGIFICWPNETSHRRSSSARGTPPSSKKSL